MSYTHDLKTFDTNYDIVVYYTGLPTDTRCHFLFSIEKYTKIVGNIFSFNNKAVFIGSNGFQTKESRNQ